MGLPYRDCFICISVDNEHRAGDLLSGLGDIDFHQVIEEREVDPPSVISAKSQLLILSF